MKKIIIKLITKKIKKMELKKSIEDFLSAGPSEKEIKRQDLIAAMADHTKKSNGSRGQDEDYLYAKHLAFGE